jgi:hypothetical protein
MRQAEVEAAQHMFSSFSSPCFNVKIVYNYRLRTSESIVIKEFLPKEWLEKGLRKC